MDIASGIEIRSPSMVIFTCIMRGSSRGSGTLAAVFRPGVPVIFVPHILDESFCASLAQKLQSHPLNQQLKSSQMQFATLSMTQTARMPRENLGKKSVWKKEPKKPGS